MVFAAPSPQTFSRKFAFSTFTLIFGTAFIFTSPCPVFCEVRYLTGGSCSICGDKGIMRDFFCDDRSWPCSWHSCLARHSPNPGCAPGQFYGPSGNLGNPKASVCLKSKIKVIQNAVLQCYNHIVRCLSGYSISTSLCGISTC